MTEEQIVERMLRTRRENEMLSACTPIVIAKFTAHARVSTVFGPEKDIAPLSKRQAEEVMPKHCADMLRSTSITQVVHDLEHRHPNATETIEWLIDNGYLASNENRTMVWQTEKTQKEIKL